MMILQDDLHVVIILPCVPLHGTDLPLHVYAGRPTLQGSPCHVFTLLLYCSIPPKVWANIAQFYTSLLKKRASLILTYLEAMCQT